MDRDRVVSKWKQRYTTLDEETKRALAVADFNQHRAETEGDALRNTVTELQVIKSDQIESDPGDKKLNRLP